jgi:pimeloyl-ACP methyl ester carboxylesterase
MWILQNVTLVIAVAVAVWCLATLVCLVLYTPKLAASFIQSAPMLIPDLRHREFPGDACVFYSSDGTRLCGTFWQSERAVARGSIVLCHEVGGERACVHQMAQWLVEAGFDVLAFDFRNHGESGPGGEYSKLFWLTTRDVDDVLAAVDHLRELSPDAPVGVYGVSRGGSAALCAASRDPRIQAVVADGPFPIYDMMLPHLRRRMRLSSSLGWVWERFPDFWILLYCRTAVRLAGHRMGCRFVDTRARARSIRQPVLLIRGELDSFVPANVIEKLRLSIRGKTDVWQAPGAKHNAGLVKHPLEYRQLVCSFFDTNSSQTERPPVKSGSISSVTPKMHERKQRVASAD